MRSVQPVIGLFDSGVGGLSVLQQLLARHADLNYVYLADSAYFPYSLQPADFIEQRVLQLCEWMEKSYPLQALVMACNTASATTYEDLVEHHLPFPVYEPIGVTCDWIKKYSPDEKNIVVLATPVTIATNAYLTNLSSQYDVTQLPSAALVQAVEQGLLSDPKHIDAAKAVLEPLVQSILSHQPDILVLGSTHFSWAKEAIAPYLPSSVKLVDSAHCLSEVVNQLQLPPCGADTTKTHDVITTAASSDFNQFVKTRVPALSNIQVQTMAVAATTPSVTA